MKRRPIKARGAKWASGLAKSLANIGVTPNQISIASVLFGFLSGVSFYLSYKLSDSYLLISAALFIQFRLICNLMDGMVAIEHKKKTKTGDIFNDVPDRFADFFIIVGAGYAVANQFMAIEVAYTSAALAIMTAYVRVLGASLKTEHFFSGPMAKQQRMALLTISSLMEVIIAPYGYSIIYLSLWIILFGSLTTIFNRLKLITKYLKEI